MTARRIRRERWCNAAQVAGLLVLVPVGAELLAAYSETTGYLGRVLFSIIFFAGLYGAPALLIRELVRRKGWGWPSLLLLSASLAVLQAGVIDQSLFSQDYGDYEGFEEQARQTWIEPLGLSAFNTQGFVIGHVVFSFAAPLALAEAWRPHRAHAPWFGWRGITVLVLLYAGASALILSDPTASGAGSTAQIAAAALVAVVFAAAALAAGRFRLPASPRRVPRLAVLVAAGLVFGAVETFVPPTWTGTGIAVAAAAVAVLAVLQWSSRDGWSIRHGAALALGVVLARGLSAFLYFPLLGEVSAPRKYAHNIAMLAIVIAAGWIALRQPRARRNAHGGN